MTESVLVRDLAVVLAIGAAVTAAFHRAHQPAVLGYLLAGMVIGPHTPPFALIRDPHSIETLAELGMILLLFSIGLETSLRKLRRVGGVALLGAALEVPVMIGLGYSAATLIGWSRMDGLFLGAILSVSSTTIIVRALMELGLTRERFARIILGILIVEDLAAIVMLVLLTGLVQAGDVGASDLVRTLAAVGAFVVFLSVAGLLVVPRLVGAMAALPSREVLTVGALGLCFGCAMLAAELGFSTALGAFLIGAVIAESRHVHEVEQRIEPIRDMFSAVFFVAVGLQIDPVAIVRNLPLVIGLSALTIFGKTVTCALATMLAGYPAPTALRVGLGMGQIGEFSFIIANLGHEAGVVSSFLYPITVAVSAVTTLTTPYQIRYAEPIARWLARLTPEMAKRFVGFYDEQLGVATIQLRRWRIPREAVRPLAGALLASILLVTLLAAARIGMRIARDRATRPLFEHDLEMLIAVGCGVIALPLIVSLWKRASEIAGAIAAGFARGATGRRVISETFRFTFVLVFAGAFLGIAAPLMPSGVALVAALALVALATVLFWRAVLRIQVRAEDVLRNAFAAERADADETSSDPQRRLVELASERYPFELVMEDVVLPLHPTAVNCSIRKLGLRSQTGATIAAIYRDEEAIVNPEPESPLRPGDVVVLIGSRAQVERAVRHLGRLSAERGARES
jgi:monovalent cation:H+ antiporter-2, CPA2 family